MSRQPVLSALRAIGWAHWDPIGLGKPGPPPRAENECDRSPLPAAGMPAEGDVSTDPQGITRHQMALPRAVPEAALGAAEAIAVAMGAG